jgi:hypothetical protein
MTRFFVRSVVKVTAVVVALGALGILAYLQHPFFRQAVTSYEGLN